MARRDLLAVSALVLSCACGSSTPPTPSPPGTGTETITGRERLGWDQPASSTTELNTFRYAIYVDNTRSQLAEVTCGATAGPAGYPCSGRLPAMANGTHTLELATFVDVQGGLESARSQPLRVTVTGIDTGATGPLSNGDVVTTNDGVQLRLEVLFDGLREPSALVVAPDGRAFVATEDGLLMLKDGQVLGPPQLTDGKTLALDLSPSFAKDGYLFVTQAVPSESGAMLFRTTRVRDMGGWLADRMVILEHGPAASPPSAALRFSADGKLHLAFDDGGSAVAAERMSEWRGKLLRMEPDGRTPPDQAAASPVLFRGLTSPRGFDWSLDGGALWVADASRDGVERLRVIATTPTQPRRATLSATYVLPSGLGAAGVAMHKGVGIPKLAGDLFIAGSGGGYILRIRFEGTDTTKPSTTERLLENSNISVRAIAVGPDGALYFCTATQVVRMTRRQGS